MGIQKATLRPGLKTMMGVMRMKATTTNYNLEESDYYKKWIMCIGCKKIKPPSHFQQGRLKQGNYRCKECVSLKYLQTRDTPPTIFLQDVAEQKALKALSHNQIWLFGKYVIEWETHNTRFKKEYRTNPFIEIVGIDFLDFAKTLWRDKKLECELLSKYQVRSETCQI